MNAKSLTKPSAHRPVKPRYVFDPRHRRVVEALREVGYVVAVRQLTTGYTTSRFITKATA